MRTAQASPITGWCAGIRSSNRVDSLAFIIPFLMRSFVCSRPGTFSATRLGAYGNRLLSFLNRLVSGCVFVSSSLASTTRSGLAGTPFLMLVVSFLTDTVPSIIMHERSRSSSISRTSLQLQIRALSVMNPQILMYTLPDLPLLVFTYCFIFHAV
jgi:hypothetical protein